MNELTYKDSGVDKHEGYRLVDKIKGLAKATHTSHQANLLGGIGSFAALYALKDYQEPILVAGTDGVGTKLALAFAENRYDSVGIDCVAMCVNDILCHGAKPLFFLDYLACGKLDAEQAADLVAGIAAGCLQADCALVGGETAEMPGFYKPGDYDIAGFALGVAEKSALINGEQIQVGQQLIGLASSGVHSNGFSLLRKLFHGDALNVDCGGKRLADVLLTPTRIYVQSVLACLKTFNQAERVAITGLAHITGGGLIENIPRILPKHLQARINTQQVPRQPIFDLLTEQNIAQSELWATFNMGVGFILVCETSQAEAIIHSLQSLGETAFHLGELVERPHDKTNDNNTQAIELVF